MVGNVLLEIGELFTVQTNNNRKDNNKVVMMTGRSRSHWRHNATIHSDP